MKFIIKNIKCILSIFIIIISNLIFCNCSKNQIKTQEKRENSIMEYFNNFFREDNLSQNIYNKININSENNENNKQYKSYHRFKSRLNYKSPKDKHSKFLTDNLNKFSFKEAESLNLNNKPSSSEIKNKDHHNHKKLTNSTLISGSKNSTNISHSRLKILKKIKKKIKKNTEIITADWFMISSIVLQNKNRFPPIKIEEDTYVAIETDENNFRINHAFDYFEGKDKPPSRKFFWLRLSGLNLYYSTSKCDLNILGVISVSHLESLSKLNYEMNEDLNIMCFRVTDKSNEVWKICGNDEEKVHILYCQLNLILGLKEKLCVHIKENDEQTTKNIIQPIIILPKPSRKCNEGWNYYSKGDDWECDCKEGREQSPIDLPKIEDSIDSPISPLFHYFRVKAKIEEDSLEGFLSEGENLRIKVFDNALRIFHPNFGKIITVDGSVYKAEEIVIHTPSEHTIDGKKYDAELQVIHYGQSKGDIAKQIVLSILFESTPGEYNKFFESIDSFNLPNVLNKEKKLCGDIFIPEIFYTSEDSKEINSIKKFSFYTYQGSLTFPPCTENTIMYVASKPIPLSSTTIKLLQEAIRIPDMNDENNNIYVSDQLPENDRLTQNRNGRPVFHFDHQKYCGPNQPKKKKEEGHFEKVKVRKDEIVYVNDKKPSGFPESFVISNDEAFGEDIIRKFINN